MALSAGSWRFRKAQEQAGEGEGGCSSCQEIPVWQQQPSCAKEASQLHEAYLCLQGHAGPQGNHACKLQIMYTIAHLT